MWSGGAKTFSAADALVVEFWPYGLERMGSDPDELGALREADFAIGQLAREGEVIRPEAFRPMAVVAAASVVSTTSGTVTGAGPKEMTIVTAEPGATEAPLAGS